VQRWDPDRYARNARFVADAGECLVEMLDPQPGERILDLGCGDGALTERLVAAGCQVVGIDASHEMVAAASARGLDARVMDGARLEFAGEFDAVFSNAALHWMRDLPAVLAGVWSALRPGGRFVGELGGDGNVETVVAAIRETLMRRGIDADAVNPWIFPSPEAFRSALREIGFQVHAADLIPRPTPLPGEIEAWLETFAESFLNRVAANERPMAFAEVREILAPRLQEPDGRWVVDYVRLRFAAIRPDPLINC
jgi:trans-aconitate methyltransferase